MKPETIEVMVKHTLTLADADGVAIELGSVLCHIEEEYSGVVVKIVRPGDMGTVFDLVGDIHIRTSPCSTRCTNNYKKWRHVPHNEQTHEQRELSFNMRFDPKGYDPEWNSGQSVGEYCAISGIKALLPSDTKHWMDDCSDDIETALYQLAKYMDELKGTK